MGETYHMSAITCYIREAVIYMVHVTDRQQLFGLPVSDWLSSIATAQLVALLLL